MRPGESPTVGLQGPGQTYPALKLARNSFSAGKLPAFSQAAHGTRPAPCPALPGPARRPSASGCLCGCSSSFSRRSGRRDASTTDPRAAVTPPSCVPYPRPFPGCCTAGNGDQRHTARSEIGLVAQLRPASRLGRLQGQRLPVVQLNGNHIPSKQGREERDGEIVQLIDRHLHGGLIHFGVHDSGCWGALAGFPAVLGCWAAAGRLRWAGLCAGVRP